MPQYIECSIRQGAFSSEFLFSLKESSGKQFEGVLPSHYFATEFKEKIPTPLLSPLQGLVRGKIIKRNETEAVVRFVDRVAKVPVSLIKS